MEVWLESLSMHLSVGMPLPPDLLFDIHHYKGQSPSSSGSTTPEGIPSGHRSPALEPICEGQPIDTKKKSSEKLNKSMEIIQKSTDNLKPIMKVSSAENLLKRMENGIKPIIKVSSSTTLLEATAKSYEFSTNSCDNICNVRGITCDLNMPKNNPPVIINSPGEFPNYENIDFLKNDMVFAGDTEKPICIQELKETELCKVDKPAAVIEINKSSSTNNENNLKQTSFSVNLRNVPKNFTRNRFAKESKEGSKEDDSPSVRDKFKFLGKSKTFDVKPLVSGSSKMSNLNLDSIGLKSTALPSQVTRKYVNSAKNVNLNSNNAYQISSSNLKDTHPVLPKSNSFDKSIGYTCHISRPSSSKSDPTSDVKSAIRSSLLRRRFAKDPENVALSRKAAISQNRETPNSPTKEKNITLNNSRKAKRSPAVERLKETLASNDEVAEGKIGGSLQNKVEQEVNKSSLLQKLTPILQRRSGFLNLETDPNVSKKSFTAASSSGNIVRDMVDSLNKKGSISFGTRVNFGRSSLKVTGTPKTNAKAVESLNPTKEYTAL